jgi:hypothetical protein
VAELHLTVVEAVVEAVAAAEPLRAVDLAEAEVTLQLQATAQAEAEVAVALLMAEVATRTAVTNLIL